jgi:predicted transcriptional regulator of viral defense system
MTAASHIERLLRHLQRHGVVRTSNLETLGVPRVVLKRAVDRGQVIRRTRGVYVMPDHAATRHTDVAVVAARTPKAVVCLVSALEYDGLTTQVPHAVWIMIHKSAHRPHFNTLAVRIVRASGPALTTGVEKHKIEGVAVQMTTPAKTVADCFRHRDTVGTDVAVEALRDCLRKRKATPSDIFEMAKVDRVARLMRPYLQALA